MDVKVAPWCRNSINCYARQIHKCDLFRRAGTIVLSRGLQCANTVNSGIRFSAIVHVMRDTFVWSGISSHQQYLRPLFRLVDRTKESDPCD
jgi:hypothetical protein